VKRLTVVVALATAFCAGLLVDRAVGALGRHPGSASRGEGKGVITIILRTDDSLPSASQRSITANDTYTFTFRDRQETAQAGDDAYRAALSHLKDD
jgi:hypothetical protein